MPDSLDARIIALEEWSNLMGNSIGRLVGIALMTLGAAGGVVYVAFRYWMIWLLQIPVSGVGLSYPDWGRLALLGIVFFVGMVVFAEVTYDDLSEK